MAISLGVGLQSGTGAGTTPSITLNGCTAGRALLIGAIVYNSTTTISSVTVTGESNAAQCGTAETMATPDGTIWVYHRPLAVSGDKTVTFNLSTGDTVSMFVMEVQGQAASPYGTAILQGDVVVDVDWITQAGNITLDGDQSMLFAMSYSNDVPSNTLIAPFDNIQTIASGGWFARAFWKFNAGDNNNVIPVEFNMTSGGTTNRHGFVVIGYKADTGPGVSTHPAFQAAAVGATATFTAAGTGTAQWQKSTDNGGTWSDISGATNATSYTTPTLAASDNNSRYRVGYTSGTTEYSVGAHLSITGLGNTGDGSTLTKGGESSGLLRGRPGIPRSMGLRPSTLPRGVNWATDVINTDWLFEAASSDVNQATGSATGRGQSAAESTVTQSVAGSALGRAQSAATGQDALSDFLVSGAGRSASGSQARAVGVSIQVVASASTGRGQSAAASTVTQATAGVAAGYTQAASQAATVQPNVGVAAGIEQAAAEGSVTNSTILSGIGIAAGAGQSVAASIEFEQTAGRAFGRGQSAATPTEFEQSAGSALGRGQSAGTRAIIEQSAGVAAGLDQAAAARTSFEQAAGQSAGRSQAAASVNSFDPGVGQSQARGQAAGPGEDAFGNLSVSGTGRAVGQSQATAVGVSIQSVASAAIGRAQASSQAVTVAAAAAAAAAIAQARAPGYPIEAATGAAISRAQASSASVLFGMGAGAAQAISYGTSLGVVPAAMAEHGRRGGVGDQLQGATRANGQSGIRSNKQQGNRVN